MFETLSIFMAGISGVFLGMAMLYFSIKIVAAIIARIGIAEGDK